MARRLREDRRRGYDQSEHQVDPRTEDRIHSAALISQIKDAASTEKLLCTYRVHESHLNYIHLSACWSSLGQLARWGPAQGDGLHMNVQVLDALVQHTVRAAWVGGIDARGLANIA